MTEDIAFRMLSQPDETTCGPTCLHAVYGFYGEKLELLQVIQEAAKLEEGGTLAVYLASHALQRGYSARVYTYNLRVFDPTWFALDRAEMMRRLQARHDFVRSAKLQRAIRGYMQLLELGGELRFEDLTAKLIQSHLSARKPILAGLSSTYLYRCAREYGPKSEFDDIRGQATGHFVVLYGYNKETREVLVADPLNPNPFAQDRYYAVNIDRVICAILLGVITYDANLLIIEPPADGRTSP